MIKERGDDKTTVNADNAGEITDVNALDGTGVDRTEEADGEKADELDDGHFRGVAHVDADTTQALQFDRFGLYIGRDALPGDRDAVRQNAEILLAPGDILAKIDQLPQAVTYRNLAEVWAAVDHEA